MTRLPRTGNGGGTRTLAAVHAQAGHYRIVVAEARNGSVALLDARSVREADLPTTLGGLIRDHKPDRVIRVVPGSQSVCRCVEVPGGEDGGVGAALALLAEAELPESLPPHRRAAGVIPGEGQDGALLGLLTGWREDAAGPAVSGNTRESWVAEVACLAALRGDSGVALYADRKDGSIAIVAGGPRRTVARILVESGESSAAWSEALRLAVRESCAAAGLERCAAPDIGDVTFDLPAGSIASLRSRVKGMRDEGRWLDEHGIALGAIMVAASHDPRVASLAEMSAAGELNRPPVWERGAAWLSKPRNAWGLTAACVALMLLGPLGIAAARVAVLNSKSGALDEGRKERKHLERQAALYEQLDQVRWPMSKLMADVAGATPVGVVIDDFRLDTNMGLTVHGTARNLEELYTLQNNLSASRIFKDVKINRQEASDALVEFDVGANIASPHTQTKPAADFGAEPLAVKLYGAGASNTAAPIAARRAQASEAARPRPSRTADASEPRNEPRSESGGDTPRRTESESSRRPGTTTPDAVPPPLTDMSRSRR
jgi:Tfp pilus assembly protein PilN